jgi:hypothetical protein
VHELENIRQSSGGDPSLSDSDVKKVALEKLAQSRVKDLFTELRTKYSQQPEYPIEMVVYFDEAHALSRSKPNNETEKTLYDVLCSVLNAFLDYPLFAIFLSTYSDLAELATPRSIARSARIRDGGATFHAPITEVPFDCYPGLPIQPEAILFAETTTIEYLAQFGRPL